MLMIPSLLEYSLKGVFEVSKGNGNLSDRLLQCKFDDTLYLALMNIPLISMSTCDFS